MGRQSVTTAAIATRAAPGRKPRRESQPDAAKSPPQAAVHRPAGPGRRHAPALHQHDPGAPLAPLHLDVHFEGLASPRRTSSFGPQRRPGRASAAGRARRTARPPRCDASRRSGSALRADRLLEEGLDLLGRRHGALGTEGAIVPQRSARALPAGTAHFAGVPKPRGDPIQLARSAGVAGGPPWPTALPAPPRAPLLRCRVRRVRRTLPGGVRGAYAAFSTPAAKPAAGRRTAALRRLREQRSRTTARAVAPPPRM